MTSAGQTTTVNAIGISERKQHNKNSFTKQENAQLRAIISIFGTGDWSAVADRMPGRTCRQCRERWAYLSPNRNNREWPLEEMRRLRDLQDEFGTRWTFIADRLDTGRTAGQVKDKWNMICRGIRSGKIILDDVPVPDVKPAPAIEREEVGFDFFAPFTDLQDDESRSMVHFEDWY